MCKKIDVIIPVYKPDEKLKHLVSHLRKQTIKPNRILLIHTEASDTKEIKEAFESIDTVKLYHIKKEEFDHGGTRNYGASLSDSPFVLFMTQDAVPVNQHLVEELIKPFEDNMVAAVYGRQLAGSDAGMIERYTRTFNYPKESSVKSKEDLERLGIKTYFCSNVCAVYRKEVYNRQGGFVRHTIFNEDMIMAANIIQQGYKIAYAADAKVIHSHKYTYRQQFARNFDLAVSQRQYKEIFESVKSESEGIRLVKKTAGYLVSHGKIYMIPDLILQSGFKYLGYKLGYHYEVLPKSVVKLCSMNKSYWQNK